MEQSILKSTKTFVNVMPTDDAFDLDILMHINGAFALLNELGVGPDEGFVVEDDGPTWASFTTDIPQQSRVKSLVLLMTKLKFDAPPPAAHLNAMNDQIKELTSRISMHREGKEWVNPNLPAEV